MRVVFMGTPDFAVPSLKALVDAGHDVRAVVTQPDRPKGRGKKYAPPPVKEIALSLNLPVIQPVQIKDPDFIDLLRGYSPEVIVVVAYGRILPPAILLLPEHGCVNVHASLLPKYRGAAPIHRAVINGEKITGVTTMFIDEGLDTGDMILREKVPIFMEDTVGDVHDRLSAVGARLLVETMDMIGQGRAPRIPQTGESSYAPVLTGADELIIWEKPAQDIYNLIRGMNPWPGARTYLGGKMLKIWRATILDEEQLLARPGRVMGTARDGILVGTGKGLLVINELQMQGAKRMSAADFLRGTPAPLGVILSNVPEKETVCGDSGNV
ncbi:methionyl-tRNA formyltransferase [Pelotomaculum isophthalicicum JI]|uniref:Methionyl-tRNA formyltransferase n=1 Tax=Pelotomaculum isophthalicicum JI TaxID=947010 RepID=A0A9X4H1K6_9FIRM|nr:methionyl-tRNA formyltransferase [Pelotomaculum isophthalicicum]MDF9408160.1 methionyl-tRNA formyltransferase [Pelotomaculum isophthalicicum JI]